MKLQVVRLACGFRSWHSMAMSEEGRCWAWGCNDDGQLGVGDTEDRDSPTLLEGYCFGKRVVFEMKRRENESMKQQRKRKAGVEGVRDALLAVWSTIVELESGELWACGGNIDGRLGVGSMEECVLAMRKVRVVE